MLNGNSSEKYSSIAKIVDQYVPGTTVDCFINPDQPQNSILRRNSLWGPFAILLFPLIFVAVGGGGIIFAWKKNDETDKLQSGSLGNNQMARFIPVIVFGIFSIAGTAMFIFLTFKPLWGVYQAQSWQKVPCTILSSEVSVESGDDGPTYWVNILYEYQFSGKRYKSNEYDFTVGASSGYEGKANVVNKYKANSSSTCYVNPSMPSSAVLCKDLHLGYTWGLFSLPFVIIGYGGLIYMMFLKKNKPTSGARSYNGSGLSNDSQLVELKTASPIKPFIIITLFSLFWNSIVTVFVSNIYFGSRNTGWFEKIFILPFIFVGIGMIGASLYYLLKCFNPKVVLQLSSSNIQLGDSAQLSWKVIGRVSRIQSLKLFLIGQEQATYTRGTDTITDTENFFEQELFATDNQYDMASGAVRLHIPGNLMHTFEAKNNKIIWQVKVKGEISKWPDIGQEFNIVVLPIKVRR